MAVGRGYREKTIGTVFYAGFQLIDKRFVFVFKVSWNYASAYGMHVELLICFDDKQ